MYREDRLWQTAESWIEQLMFDGVLRLSDIPRELRIGSDTFYVAAFRISRNISDTWFVQDLKLLEYDIMSVAKGSSKRKKMLDMLSFNLQIGEGKKEVVDYAKGMDKEILRELSERQGAKQSMLSAQLAEYSAATRAEAVEGAEEEE